MVSPSNVDVVILAEFEAAEKEDATAKGNRAAAFMHRIKACYLLLEKKESIPHDGAWKQYLRWVIAELARRGYRNPITGNPYSMRWIQDWMFLAKHLPTEAKAQPVSFLGMKEGLEQIRDSLKPKPKVAAGDV